jgi:hypothetical protein
LVPIPPVLLRFLIAALITIVSATAASAQLVRLTDSQVLTNTESAFDADAAYDSGNGVYLVVMSKESRVPPGNTIVGVFVGPTGVPIGREFTITFGQVHFPRIVYSRQAPNGPEGNGAFIVTWADWSVNRIRAHVIAYPGWGIFPVATLGAGYGVPEVAYSETSQMLVTTWSNYYAPRTATFSRGSVISRPVGEGPIIPHGTVTIPDAGRSPVIWNTLTDVAWHAARNEFGILYAQRASPWALRFARMDPAGAILDDRAIATLQAEPLAAALEFSPLTGNYVALWADPQTGRITSCELSETGTPLARGLLPASIVGGENGMALAYNRVSGTFLPSGIARCPRTQSKSRDSNSTSTARRSPR